MGSEQLSQSLSQQIEDLRQEVEKLKAEKKDLEILLETTLTHADLIEDELHHSNQRLKAEVVERQRVQAALEVSQTELQSLLKIVIQEKTDLEIVLETTTEHGDFIEALLYRQSFRDSLTGLYNRRYLEKQLIHEIQKAQEMEQSFGIIMLDVDYFKQFNDTHGHEAGDLVLEELSRYIVENIRSSDIACRYGGEELTVIMPEVPLAIAQARAEQLRKGIKQLQLQCRNQLLGTISISLGVACYPQHGQSGAEILQAADAALYLAKTQGRDRVVCADALPLFQTQSSYQPLVPQQFLQFLDRKTLMGLESCIQKSRNISVLFADIQDFSQLSATMTPRDNFKFVNAFLSRIQPAIVHHNGLVNNYVGSAVMALFNQNADNALQAAIAILQEMQIYNQTRQRPERPPISMGIAVNTSSLNVETVGGYNKVDETVISDIVNLASRVQGLTQYYEVPLLISHSTYLSLKSPSQYATRIIDQVKVQENTEAVTIYEVFNADIPEVYQKKSAIVEEFEKAMLLYKIGNFVEAANSFQLCSTIYPEDKATQTYLQHCKEQIGC